jgi:hypothetical protein
MKRFYNPDATIGSKPAGEQMAKDCELQPDIEAAWLKQIRACWAKNYSSTGDDICRLVAIIDRQAEQIKAKNKAINSVPLHEYSDALRDGCSHNCAWDCFMEAFAVWKEHALKEGD